MSTRPWADPHDRAWRWLAEQDVDVALLQEAVPPMWAGDLWPAIIHAAKYPDSDRVQWGSAVVSRSGDLDEFTPLSSQPWLTELWGAAVVAQPQDPEGRWFASIHSNAYPLAEAKLMGREAELMRRCHPTDVWEIEALAQDLEGLFQHRSFIAGGDLNSALLFDTNYGYDSNARLFENLAEGGFHDLRTGRSVDEQRTYYKAGKGHYQLDHLYADAKTAAACLSWQVQSDVAERLLLSDHTPVIVELP